ncbi:hypothetical protein VTK56DRAFT_9612 [Thermocarpiscus australiensis]
MAVSQERITVYNLADLKNTSDDAIPNYLNSLHFTQSHRLTDGRLALGYVSLLLAAACFAWDYKLGFDATKHLTAGAVALYFLLNGALTAWLLYVERGTVYEGTAPPSAGGEKLKLRIATATRKHVPTYHVTVEIFSSSSGKEKKEKKETLEISRSFTEWFDAAGHFVAAPFQSMLASSVPVIGRLDPKRVVAPPGEAAASAAYTPEMLDALAEANASVVGSAAEAATCAEGAAAKKGGRRRKA